MNNINDLINEDNIMKYLNHKIDVQKNTINHFCDYQKINEDIKEYFNNLNSLMDIVKIQAFNAINNYKEGKGIILFQFDQRYLDQLEVIKKLYNKIEDKNIKENLIFCNIAPIQIDIFARQIALTPGLLNNYKNIMNFFNVLQ